MFENIRKKLKKEHLDAYVATYGNCFLAQDVLPKEHKIKKLCGFDGSAGVLIISANQFFLLVDGRYTLQAKLQTAGKNIQIIESVPDLFSACKLLEQKNLINIGIDFWDFSALQIGKIKENFSNINLKDFGCPIRMPKTKCSEIFFRDKKFSGQSGQEKCRLVAEQIKQNKADFFLFTSADSVSWLLNVYTRDLPYSPVLRAYATVDKSGKVKLFGRNLPQNGNTYNFADLENFLSSKTPKTVLFDAKFTPQKILEFASDNTKLTSHKDICQTWKAKKNNVELEGMINCHKKDAIAIIKTLIWLENNWHQKTELDVVKKMQMYRRQQQDYFGASFATIAGFGENGAIVHYIPNKQTNKELQEGNLLLLDSGGQYLDGTTDVTRTIAIGEPRQNMIDDFTTVLKAHIALADAQFAQNTTADRLDALARCEMLKQGYDYRHSTGHGVACFGNVHEGPVIIGPTGNDCVLSEHMVTSIEPGLYKENEYGIRIENLYYTSKVDEQPDNFAFKVLTLVPIDKRLINVYMLSRGEQQWLNDYHKKIYDCLAAYVNDKERKWLEKACSPL